MSCAFFNLSSNSFGLDLDTLSPIIEVICSAVYLLPSVDTSPEGPVSRRPFSRLRTRLDVWEGMGWVGTGESPAGRRGETRSLCTGNTEQGRPQGARVRDTRQLCMCGCVRAGKLARLARAPPPGVRGRVGRESRCLHNLQVQVPCRDKSTYTGAPAPRSQSQATAWCGYACTERLPRS